MTDEERCYYVETLEQIKFRCYLLSEKRGKR